MLEDPRISMKDFDSLEINARLLELWDIAERAMKRGNTALGNRFRSLYFQLSRKCQRRLDWVERNYSETDYSPWAIVFP